MQFRNIERNIRRVFLAFLLKNGIYNNYLKNLKRKAIPSSPSRFIDCFNWVSSPERYTFWLDIDCEWIETLTLTQYKNKNNRNLYARH